MLAHRGKGPGFDSQHGLKFIHDISVFMLIFCFSFYDTRLRCRAFLPFYNSFTTFLVNANPSFLLLVPLLSSPSVCKLCKENKHSFSISMLTLYLPDTVGTKHRFEIVTLWSIGTENNNIQVTKEFMSAVE